jgi:hypothetical protein
VLRICSFETREDRLAISLLIGGAGPEEDHRAFRALSVGQENRKANWVKLRPFGALNLVKTAERLAVVARWIRMARRLSRTALSERLKAAQPRSEMTKNAKRRANPSGTSPTTTFLDFLGGSFIKDRSLNRYVHCEMWAKHTRACIRASCRAPNGLESL